MSVPDRQVRDIFIELTDTLVADFDIIDFLDRLAVHCAGLLGIAACGIVVVDHHRDLNLVAASTEEARLLELIQVQNTAGPCLDAYQSGVPVQCADLGEVEPGSRWSRFAEAARAAGFSSVHALPMRLRDDKIGAMNLFGAAPGPLDAETVALGQALADAATIGIVHQRAIARQEVVTEQLQNALNSRIMIEQAKGYLAERLGLSIDAAFDTMREHARDNNLKLTEVAGAVITGRLTADGLAGAARREAVPPSSTPGRRHPSR